MRKDFSPYKPFFSVLSQSDCKPDENLISKSAYSVQKKSFLSYFKDGIADCVSAGSGAEGSLERSGRPSVSGPRT